MFEKEDVEDQVTLASPQLPVNSLSDSVRKGKFSLWFMDITCEHRLKRYLCRRNSVRVGEFRYESLLPADNIEVQNMALPCLSQPDM